MSDTEDGATELPPQINELKRKLDDDEENGSPSPKKSSEAENHTKIVANHYNELKEKGLVERLQSRIFHMRNFNNWVKSMLINEYLTKIKSSQKLGSPLRVLDMCCGKGGDLLKWEKGGITHLICTDIAEVSIQQCETRYASMMSNLDKKFGKKFTAEFFACDSTLVRLREKYKDPSMQLNLVSCQFALHYCFESLKQAECMIRNAAECLQPGGYFIATIPDSNEIMRRQRENGSKSFGNSVYKISFVCDTVRPPLFGAKYNFHLDDVVDCPEFLVHFPTLVKLCKKFGLQLMQKESFADFYNRCLEDGKFLLERMQSLETYPNRQDALLGKDEGDYSHAEEYLSKPGNKYKTIGTLSTTEWEAITLYTVLAFRKCKTTWDAEGKPIYEEY